MTRFTRYDDPLYPVWLAVREAVLEEQPELLRSTLPVALAASTIADIAVDALRRAVVPLPEGGS